MDLPPFARVLADGIEINIRLTTRASKDGVDGMKSGADGAVHLAVRVRALPEKGAANSAVARLIAGWLGVAASTVSIVGGHTQRLKRLSVEGDPARLAKMIGDRLATF